MSSDFVCIAVSKGILVFIDAGHEDSVECRDTATTDFAQVNVVFDVATEHVWGEILRFVEILLSGQVHAVIVVEC